MIKQLAIDVDLSDSKVLSSLKEGIFFTILYMVAYTIVMAYPVQQYFSHRGNMEYFLTSSTIAIFAVAEGTLLILGIILLLQPVFPMLKKTTRAFFLFYLIAMSLVGGWYVTIIEITKPGLIV